MTTKRVTAKLLQAHKAALAQGDHENAQAFSDAAARYVLFATSDMPYMPSVPTRAPRKAPAKRRRKGTKSRAAAPSAHNATRSKADRENAMLAAFIATTAVLCLLALFFSAYHPGGTTAPHAVTATHH